jgi:calcium/calmodulin-dependent protein kinase I
MALPLPLVCYCSLGDLYEVGAVLGKGGFATVREAVERGTQRRVALKILNPKATMSPATRKAALHEVLVLKRVNQLRNPNLLHFVAAHEDVSSTTGLPRLTFVTDLCNGGELFDRIVARGHYTEADAAQLVAKLARALQALHSSGVVHRDLKPENILYLSKDEASEPVIADFGLAKMADAPDACAGQLVGTHR